MRLLFVIAALRNGGAERVLSCVANELSKDNDVSVAFFDENLGLYEFNKNIKFYDLKDEPVSPLFFKFKKILALRKLFKKVEPDVVIGFIDWTNVLCVVANLGLKYKLIATEHHVNDYLKDAKFRLIRDLAYKKVDMLCVLNKTDFNYYKFVKNRVILHNPLFLDEPKSLHKENIILSVARLEWVKGYDIYFRALAKIDKKILNNYKIQIIGDGRLKNELVNLSKELGLDIEFLGHKTDVGRFYERAKVVVVSSRSEGFCNVLIEAANFGCVRITSDTAGAKELVKNGVDGIVFESCNDDELAFAMTNVLNSDRLCNMLVKNAKAKVGEFRVENIIKKWQKMIEEVVQR